MSDVAAPSAAPAAAPIAAPAAPAAAPIAPGPAVNAIAPTPVAAPVVDAPIKVTTWTDGLDEGTKDYVATKGFQSPSSVIESYRNLEKLRGVPDNRLLKIPEASDSPEWSGVYSKLGKPDTAEGYDLQVEKGQDDSFVNWAKDAFFKNNLTKDQAHQMVNQFKEFTQHAESEGKKAHETKTQAQDMDLRKDWGMAYHQNTALAQRIVAELGVSGEVIDSLEKTMGFSGVMKFFHNLGTKVGESQYVGGAPGTNPNAQMTPQQAKAALDNRKKDRTFTQKYLARDTATVAEMQNLHKMAFPDSVPL